MSIPLPRRWQFEVWLANKCRYHLFGGLDLHGGLARHRTATNQSSFRLKCLDLPLPSVINYLIFPQFATAAASTQSQQLSAHHGPTHAAPHVNTPTVWATICLCYESSIWTWKAWHGSSYNPLSMCHADPMCKLHATAAHHVSWYNYWIRYQLHVIAGNSADTASASLQTTHRCQISACPVYAARHGIGQMYGRTDRSISS